MGNNQDKLSKRCEMKIRGQEYLKTNPPVEECINAFLENGSHFAYAFLPSDETGNKFPEYMIKNEDEIKKEIHNVISIGYLKFDKIVLLFEFYEEYGVLDEYLEKMSNIESPNLKNILWYKFLKDNFTHDFRDELDYDFDELTKLIET